MSKIDITKGPWGFDDGDYTIYHLETGSFIAEIVCRPRPSDTIANARLIAAAPELLSAVKDFARTVEYLIRVDMKDGDDEGARLKQFTLARLNAMIAKATGRELTNG